MIFIFLIAVSLYAAGREDKNLAGADELIARGKLNEALFFLEKYVTRNPHEFDNVQRRIDKIFKLRSGYTAAAEELIDVIIDEPLNDEKKLRFIARLENYENDPTETELQFIDETKVASQFTYYRAVFDNIMSESSRLMEQRRFGAAVRRLSDGFVLYKDEFYYEFADTPLLTQSDTYLSDMLQSVNAYESLQNKLIAAFKRFNASLSAYDIDASLDSYKTIDSVLHEYADIRNTFVHGGHYFRESFRELKKQNLELTEASFLPFAYRLILGRESNPDTGIVRAMDMQWDILCSESRVLLTAFMEKYSNDLAEELPAVPSVSGSNLSLKDKAGRIVSVADMGKAFIFLYSLLEQPEGPAMPSFYTAYNAALDYNKTLMQAVQKLYSQRQTFAAEKDRYDNISVPSYMGLKENLGFVSYSDSLKTYGQNKFKAAAEVRQDIKILTDTRRPFLEPELTHALQSFSLPPWEPLYTVITVFLDSFAAENIVSGIDAWEDISSFVKNASSAVKKRYTSSYEEYTDLINESLDTARPSLPSEALTELQKLKKDLNEEMSSLYVRFNFLSTAPDSPVRAQPGSQTFVSNYKSASSDLDFLKDLLTRIDTSASLAQRRIRAAQQAKNEADFRYTQARTALQEENFDASRESLQQARNKYNESLLYQDSPSLRAQTDERLDALGADIVRLENNKVVRDVRLLIIDARNLYYNSDFEQAERLILQAEDRWAVTNIDPNTEVVNLKALIGNALSIRTGRSIPVTDPLYPEISQTLNAAYQYFEQGTQKIKSGLRAEGIEILNTAREKIKDVQVLYPLNQEANLLALRISKVINPADFEEIFKQRYTAAKNEYRNPATVGRAYADLKDLYEINPKYPGLKQLIYDIEVEIGVIVPPPDPRKIARSKQLVQEAARLYESSTRDEMNLNNALGKLDEALLLNPENAEAMILADRIKTGLGGKSLVVLPAEKELLYQQAVQELSKGNTITAAAIVASLWQDPKLRNSAKIIDLKNKVDSLL
ncbi:hypothetical protein H0R92_13605 [Treponema sp. OMZ 840]|uniref:hypothetical protein n=1 Tax=Treponema sp. OMZ 840 TaxID=244313 RepID=UPI003D911992